MRIIAIVLFALALAGCMHSDYLGKSYPATQSAELFLDEADVKEDYEVMGEVTLETESDMDFAVSSDDMQKKVMEVATEKGADAVILGSLEKRSKGESSSVTGNMTSTNVKESKQVKAKLIKYKKNIPAPAAPGY